MAKKKPVWPSQYLVVCRTNLDELPMLLTPDRKAAHRFAKTATDKDIDAAAKTMEVDNAGRVCMAVIWFRNGLPKRVTIVRNLES